MSKKLLSILLCLLMVCSLPMRVWAEPSEEESAQEETQVQTIITVSSAQELLRLAENCQLDSYSQNLTVKLMADIAMGSVPFPGIPIFSGTFEGNGHTITGLSVVESGSYMGLFRYTTATAVIRDLTVKGSVRPQGSGDCVGGIVGENAGRLQNCVFSGTVSGGDRVGGLVGTNTVTGIIENCRAEGQVQADHFIGGICGENMGVIRGCINQAPVNVTPQQNTVALSDITIDTLTNSESANTVTDVGGIAGTSGGTIRDCDNFADVGYRQMGYNIGGIAGSQMGYLVDCQNFGSISGRKEVGGIVGQLEPVTNIIYTEDTLQTLQKQLDAMGALTSRASATAQNSANAITGQISAMQEHTYDAMDAIGMLIPNGFDPVDPDQQQAAQNALNSSFSGMQNSLQSIASATQGTAEALSQDLRAITGQVSAMGATLKNAPENLGGSVTDVSDLDTPEDTSGKIENCGNYGDVLADINAGGIVGAMAPENDLDPEADVKVTGEMSLNFDSELRAVVLACDNFADLTVSKQGGGGIAGSMALGLVKACTSIGTVAGQDAQYVGGVTGEGAGFIRSCMVKSDLTGSRFVGGIAGSAEIITDCYALLQLSAEENGGGIVGYVPVRDEIRDNYYLTMHKDPGAIDGISYEGCAQPLAAERFLALEQLPTAFKTFTVTFTFEDGTMLQQSVVPGEALKEGDIPGIPEKTGYTAGWEGLEDLQVAFDTEYAAVYTPYQSVMASEALRNNQHPLVLAEGVFLPGGQIRVQTAQDGPALNNRQSLAECVQIHLPESTEPMTVRYLPPRGTQIDRLFFLAQSGEWKELPFAQDGSYLVFDAPQEAFTLAAVETEPIRNLLFVGLGAVVLLTGIIVFVCVRKRRSKA